MEELLVVGHTSQRFSKLFGLPIDLVLPCVIGILALSFVLGGNIFIEEQRVSDHTWNVPPPTPEVKYRYDDQELITIDGWTDEGATSDEALGQLPLNVTAVHAVLTWTDDIGTNDVLRLVLTLNGTDLGTIEGSSGSIELEVVGNATELRSEILSGAFGAKVTAVSCPGRVGPIPVDLDDGNDWNLRVIVTVRTRV